jgi:hypothetical protein
MLVIRSNLAGAAEAARSARDRAAGIDFRSPSPEL